MCGNLGVATRGAIVGISVNPVRSELFTFSVVTSVKL